MLDPVEEVGRHRLGQSMTSYHQVDRVSRGREIGGRLSSRVAPADDDDLVSRLDVIGINGGVEHADALELFDAGELQPSVAHTGGDDDGLAQQVCAVFQHDVVIAVTV